MNHRRSDERVPSASQHTRSGFVLPLVLITTLLMAVLAASLQAAVWRATRHARLGFAGERALHAADAAIGVQLAQWDARAFASLPVGTRATFTPALPASLSATVTIVRTSIDGALIEALGTSAQNGIPETAARRIARVLTIRNPPLKLTSPLTILGNAVFANAGIVTTTDETPSGWSTECIGSDSIDAPNASVTDTLASRALFDARWNQWLATASRSEFAASVTALAPIVSAGLCAPGAGDPQRGGGSVTVCTNEWGARAVTNAWPLTVTASSRIQGVLMIDGDLNVKSDLEIFGLLLVRGALNDSGGHLRVMGAALVRDEMNHGSRFGFA
ncbi:MAG: hypothetical protein ABJB74_18300, partial [Gemmatimonas sp.]